MIPACLKKIYLLASSLGIYFISRYVIKTFEELRVASFLFILLFNTPSFVRLFLWISGFDRKISIKVLTVNYLSGFLLYLLCIVGLFITGEKYNVLAGAIPLASYFTIGSIFVLHGINFLLLFPKTIFVVGERIFSPPSPSPRCLSTYLTLQFFPILKVCTPLCWLVVLEE